MAEAVNYLADVRRYDAGASEAVVQKIVKHLGIALNSPDSRLVACSDQTEKDRVKTSWVEGKLGLSGDTQMLINDVCEEMKGDVNKQRVTFYYLLAMHTGKLGDL